MVTKRSAKPKVNPRVLAMKQMEGLSRYMKYIKIRLRYIDNGLLECSEEETEFYSQLYMKIMKWAQCRENKVYFLFIIKKIKVETAAKVLGCSVRTTLEKAKVKREEFIANIKQWEKELIEKYPFNPNSAVVKMPILENSTYMTL